MVYLTLSLLLAACDVKNDGVIYTAKHIVTMDPATPQAEAVYLLDGKINQLGSVDQLKIAHPGATIDTTFARQTLIPGLIDPHVHMILGAMIYSRPFVPPWDMETPSGLVKGLPSKTALLERLKELDRELEPGEPLIAYGYHNLVQGDLVREDLDGVSISRPIVVWHYSAHDFYLNTEALKWADIEASLHQKFEGIALDANGELTGRVYEDATQHLLTRLGLHILTPANIGKGFSGFEAMLAKAGVTSVAELGYGLFNQTLEDSYYFLEYTKSDPYHLYLVPEHRAFNKKYGDKAPQEVQSLAEDVADAGDPQVLRQVKFFTDAAFYSQTMRLEQPGYIAGQSKGTLGLWVTESDDLVSAIEPYWALGLDARIHSNGDAAQTATLDAMTQIRASHPNRDQRFVIEHAGLLTPNHLQRIAKLKGGISAASHYVYLMGDDYRESIGERVQYMTPLASAVALSIPTTLHSDAPLAPPYPMQAASVHMTRETRSGNISTPSEALSAYQALRSVTLDAAWTMGLEDSIGSISIGKRANFTVLDKNPLASKAKDWPKIKVWGVVLDGDKRPLN
ncbi:MAG: putative amidohydrolase YtcJ [Arenicella sp.]|jgi:predicted amidohydrolase YtcJ